MRDTCVDEAKVASEIWEGREPWGGSLACQWVLQMRTLC